MWKDILLAIFGCVLLLTCWEEKPVPRKPEPAQITEILLQKKVDMHNKNTSPLLTVKLQSDGDIHEQKALSIK